MRSAPIDTNRHEIGTNRYKSTWDRRKSTQIDMRSAPIDTPDDDDRSDGEPRDFWWGDDLLKGGHHPIESPWRDFWWGGDLLRSKIPETYLWDTSSPHHKSHIMKGLSMGLLMGGDPIDLQVKVGGGVVIRAVPWGVPHGQKSYPNQGWYEYVRT